MFAASSASAQCQCQCQEGAACRYASKDVTRAQTAANKGAACPVEKPMTCHFQWHLARQRQRQPHVTLCGMANQENRI